MNELEKALEQLNIKYETNGKQYKIPTTKENLVELLKAYIAMTINLQSKIDKANELLEEILVVSDWEHKGRFRPVKGTTSQDVYKTIVMLNELLETPHRQNYDILKEDK